MWGNRRWMAYSTKDKRNAYARRWYRLNADKHKRMVAATKKRHRESMRGVLRVARAGGCADCGIVDHRVLHFHHVGGDKSATIATVVRLGWRKERIQSEIDKCIVLCANCHAIRHYLARKEKAA